MVLLRGYYVRKVVVVLSLSCWSMMQADEFFSQMQAQLQDDIAPSHEEMVEHNFVTSDVEPLVSASENADKEILSTSISSSDAPDESVSADDAAPLAPSTEDDVTHTPAKNDLEKPVQTAVPDTAADKNTQSTSSSFGTYVANIVNELIKSGPGRTLVVDMIKAGMVQAKFASEVAIISFMGYKTYQHIKKLYTDKDRSLRHLIRASLYGGGGLIAFYALMSFIDAYEKNPVMSL